MIKRIIFIFCIVFLCLVPITKANDGGGIYPDFNEYVSYTVETDCKEIVIGEELEFTMTLTNHTKATFTHFRVWSIFSNTYFGLEDEMSFWDCVLQLEPYSTQKITLSYIVPEDVSWYKKGDDFFVDLEPNIAYGVEYESDEKLEELGLPYDFFENMIGPSPVPIKLNNLNDGSGFIDFNIIDDKELFIYSDKSDSDDDKSWMYFGEYGGVVSNYLSIENISDKSVEVVYIDWYKDFFYEYDEKYYIDAGDSIVIDVVSVDMKKPKDVERLKAVKYNMLFKDEVGEYYGVTTGAKYQTKVYEIPPVEITATKIGENKEGNQLLEISFKNTSNKDIKNFFLYYGSEFPKTEEELNNNVIRDRFEAGDTWQLTECITIPNDKDYPLMLGYWIDDSLCYWEVDIYQINNDTPRVYSNEDYYYGLYRDIYDLTHDIEIFDIYEALRPTPTPEITNTPKPEITAEVVQTIAPTNTPQTTNVVVKEVKSYVIPLWVYVVLGLAFVAVVGLVVLKKCSDSQG